MVCNALVLALALARAPDDPSLALAGHPAVGVALGRRTGESHCDRMIQAATPSVIELCVTNSCGNHHGPK